MSRRRPGLAAAVLALLLLGGCATAPSPGGGPLAPYTIDGRRYVPLREWRGYTEEGLASWYGPGYHGRPTANGEVFDAHALTAAHPVLPMAVCVQVDNLDNGRSVMVRINDRGPFVPGRIIDLSQAAAEVIGMLSRGLAPVRVTAVALAADGDPCPAAPQARTRPPPGSYSGRAGPPAPAVARSRTG
jgi:rare lipoprotein A